MFDYIRKHTRVLFFFLMVLIIPSFVFFGIDGYRRQGEGGNVTVAEVAGNAITQAQWDAAHRTQVERIRRQMPNIDAAVLDTPAFKRQSLEALVREQVLLAAADKLHLTTTDERMLRLFRADPQFEFLRNPDGSVNAAVLAAQGLSSEGFAERLRQDMSVGQVMTGVSATAVAPAAAAATAFDALFQRREVQLLRFDTKEYAKALAPTDAELQAFHADPKNAAEFQAPERADIEYVVLDLDALKKRVTIAEGDLRSYYEQNIARYSTPEERRASHILIKADAKAPAEERAKARARAEALLAELKANPAAFAELARKNSDDPGSAANGGDLDYFSRGAMVKPFETAAFALEAGAVSGVVESDFGFHIIKLTGVRGGDKRSFETVRSEIETEVRRSQAEKKFAELASEFNNIVYEQADSLKPAADKFGLTVQRAQNVTRAVSPEATGPLASQKFHEALFAPDTLRNKRNTDAIETAPSQLVAGRVTQYNPSRLLPFAEVRDRVRERVVAQQAAELARKNGEARLKALKDAPQSALTDAKREVSRAHSEGLSPKLVEAILAAPAAALPAHVGVDLGREGYVVARVLRVVGRDPVAADPVAARAQYEKALAEAETQAYYESLKKRFKVEIKLPALPSAAALAASAAER